MKSNLLYRFFILFTLTVLAGCQAEYSEYDNGVFITEARKNKAIKITIDDKGGAGNFSARVSKITSSDVTVTFNIVPEALAHYNSINGTAYNLLPAEYYTLGATVAIIKAGEIGSASIPVIIKPFDEKIDQNKNYAIPIALESAEGERVMQDTRHLMLLIDQVIVTTVPYISTTSQMPAFTFKEPKAFGQWTLEWLLNEDAFNRNNVKQWGIKGATNAYVVYTRFGDVTCPQNCFQAKIGSNKPQSGTALAPKKWYHLALVYDGANITFYINGEQDMKTAHGTPGEIFMFSEVSFASNESASYVLKGMASELRLWSVARTSGEIANNMYTVDPKTNGLEIYWKANEGTGSVLKDSSPNGRDGVMKAAPVWKSGIRFPEGQ